MDGAGVVEGDFIGYYLQTGFGRKSPGESAPSESKESSQTSSPRARSRGLRYLSCASLEASECGLGLAEGEESRHLPFFGRCYLGRSPGEWKCGSNDRFQLRAPGMWG